MELLNPGGTPVTLAGWSLTDAATGSKHPWPRTCVLPAGGGCAVLCKDSAALVAQRVVEHSRVFPVPGFPSLNNGGDAVVLFDERGRTIDSVAYLPSWSTKPGVSLERVDALEESTWQGNWGSCLDSAGATPGAANSIARMDYDLSVRRFGVRGLPSTRNRLLHASVRNDGRLAAVGARVRFDDIRGTAEPVCLGRTTLTSSLAPGDSLEVETPWPDPPAGCHRLQATVEWEGDQRRSNDCDEDSVWIPFAVGPLCISEIMAAPLTGDAEYIEVANAGGEEVDLRGWTLNGRPFAAGVSPSPLAGGGIVSGGQRAPKA